MPAAGGAADRSPAVVPRGLAPGWPAGGEHERSAGAGAKGALSRGEAGVGGPAKQDERGRTSVRGEQDAPGGTGRRQTWVTSIRS
jgi:hypothetical protein